MQLTKLIETINKKILDRAEPSEIKPLLNTLQEHAEALVQSHAELEAKYSEAQKRISQLEQSHPVSSATDTCPYCKQLSGALEDIKPDETFGDFGVKIHSYKCNNPKCGKTYDKKVDP